MNVLPSILGYGSSSSSSGTSGHSTPLSSFETSPRIIAPDTTEADGGKNLSFVQKLFASSNTCGTFSTPVICAANPCPIILNATCVFYEGPNLIYSGVNTNDSLQTIIEKFDYQLQQATAIWGNITGTVTNQTDLMNYLSNNYVSSVGLSMPSAFVVTNSPVTTTGTLTVTGAGNVYQYVRGDGTLGDFPGGGGGSSVSYYLNGSINQGVIGGDTYYQMSKTAIIGSGTNFSISSNGYIAEFITDPGDPALLNIPGGSWNIQLYMNADSAGGSPNFYVELYKYDGAIFTLIANSAANPEFITGGSSIDLYYTSIAVPNTVLLITDRLVVRVYVNNSGKTITLHTEGTTLGQVITTFSTGITALNGLTSQVQFLTTGTSGLDFNISSATSTHTFNLPVASATNTGKLSNTDWSTFNAKVGGTGTINYVSKFTGVNTISDSQIFDNGTNIGIGTATPDPTAKVQIDKTDGYGLYLNYTTNTGVAPTAVALWALNTTSTGGYAAIFEEKTPVNSGGQYPILLKHSLSSGTAAAGMGTGLHFDIPDDAGTFKRMQLTVETTDAAAATYSSRYRFLVRQNNTGVNVFYITGTGIGVFNSAPSYALDVTGEGRFTVINNATIDTDKFLVSDGGVIKYRTGAEVLSDIGAQGALTLTTTGSSGASTLIGNTLNVPNYTLSGLGGVPTSRTLTINGTTHDLSADRSWSVGTVTTVAASAPLFISGSASVTPIINISQANTSTDGFLSSIDWNTFNNKIGGSGTTNYIPKFTSSSVIGNSQIFDNGTNVGIGTTVPAFKLQVDGGDSSFNGVRVGRGLSGDPTNTTVGAGALSSITVGTDNVALGYFALSSATLSGNNIAIGSVAMSGMTSGQWNIGIGKRALQVNATSFNMAVGNEAMVFTTSGAYNTALGHSSLAYNTTGVNNTAIGYYSGGAQNVGQYNQTASNSVYIGYYCNAGGNGNNANEIVIGANTGGNGSNSATLGNTSIANTYLRGNINFNTVNAATVDTDRFLVSDLGVLKYRTGSEVLSDIGGQGALTLTTTGTSGASTLIGNTLNIPQYQAVLTNPVTGTGTTNYVTKWITSSTVGNSLLYDDGSAFAIGTASINASALFQMDSTTKGFLPPRMTQTQRTAIASPAEGLIVFQTDGVIGLYIYANATWRSLTMV